MPPRRLLFSIPALALILYVTAMANATPLTAAVMVHLLSGGALIGFAEGRLLEAMWKCPGRGAVTRLISANYVSAWAGTLLLSYASSLADVTIENIPLWLAACPLVSLPVTVILEFPFFLSALRGKEHPARRAVKASLVINSVSHVLIYGCFWLTSGVSLMTEIQVVRAGTLFPGTGYSIYYVTKESAKAVRLDPGRTGVPEVISSVAPPPGYACLVTRGDPDTGFTLLTRLRAERPGTGEESLLLAFAGNQTANYHGPGDFSGEPAEPEFNYGRVPSFVKHPDWRFRTGYRAADGIRGKNAATGEDVHFSMETPTVMWSVRCATHLEGDFLVFQLGRDQICLLHVPSRRISLLARGVSPVVVEGEPLPGAPAAQ